MFFLVLRHPIQTLTLPYGTSPELWKKWGRPQPPCIIASHFTMCVFVWVFERGSLATPPFFTIEKKKCLFHTAGDGPHLRVGGIGCQASTIIKKSDAHKRNNTIQQTGKEYQKTEGQRKKYNNSVHSYFLAIQPYTSPWWLAKLFYFIGLDSFLMRICWRAIQHDNNHAQTSQASQGAINKPMAYAQPKIQRALTDSNIAWQPCSNISSLAGC